MKTKTQQGKVIKAIGGFFYISYNGKTVAAKVRKKLSYNNMEISVGDNVEFFFNEYKKAVIEDVLPRKNELIRPNVANVDVAAIVVASVPQPDFVLVDKIILNCYIQDIKPVIIVNKSDINGEEFFEQISKEYGDAVSQIISVSAETDYNLDEIKQALKGETTVFCGQSAVGKTSLLNKIAEKNQATGGISEKSGRGKHTTRHNQIFDLGDETFIVDTPGFSLLELKEIESSELHLYYTDMVEMQNQCKYHMCTHTTEPDCCVKKALEQGKFDKNRYQRYLTIFEELKEAEKNKF
ncbi:MAG: ribosome small subunit-dependent GTPase A [Clostridia bacterium]|nr:ribosome small subunit-dependent GTPase A [Clostridia bacterium]